MLLQSFYWFQFFFLSAFIRGCTVDVSSAGSMLFLTTVDTEDGDFNTPGGAKAIVPVLPLLLCDILTKDELSPASDHLILTLFSTNRRTDLLSYEYLLAFTFSLLLC